MRFGFCLFIATLLSQAFSANEYSTCGIDSSIRRRSASCSGGRDDIAARQRSRFEVGVDVTPSTTTNSLDRCETIQIIDTRNDCQNTCGEHIKKNQGCCWRDTARSIRCCPRSIRRKTETSKTSVRILTACCVVFVPFDCKLLMDVVRIIICWVRSCVSFANHTNQHRAKATTSTRRSPRCAARIRSVASLSPSLVLLLFVLLLLSRMDF